MKSTRQPIENEKKSAAGSVQITVEGGVVVNVEGLPPGYAYEVRDIDVEKHG